MLCCFKQNNKVNIPRYLKCPPFVLTGLHDFEVPQKKSANIGSVVQEAVIENGLAKL